MDRMIEPRIAVYEQQWLKSKEAAREARVSHREWIRQAIDEKLLVSGTELEKE